MLAYTHGNGVLVRPLVSRYGAGVQMRSGRVFRLHHRQAHVLVHYEDRQQQYRFLLVQSVPVGTTPRDVQSAGSSPALGATIITNTVDI